MFRSQGQPDVKEEEMMARQTVRENLIWFAVTVAVIRVGKMKLYKVEIQCCLVKV